jgi:hypothetical protein
VSFQEPKDAKPVESKSKEIVLAVPFAAGEPQTVSRGPGQASHKDAFNRHAIDFAPLVEGHPVHAAARGRVVWVKEDTAGPTGDWRDNNEVAIELPAGAGVVVYFHFQKDGVVVAVGDEVLPGDLIGRVGNTGKSEGTHLHVDVRKGHRQGPSVPWRFDVVAAGTVPVVGSALKVENTPWRPVLEPWLCFERMHALATGLDDRVLVAAMQQELAKAATRPVGESEVDDDLRDYRRELHERIDAAWAEAAKQAAKLLADTQDPGARAVLALETAQCFPGTEAAANATKWVTALAVAARQTAQREVANRKRARGSLQEAFAVEWKLALDGQSPPYAEPARKKVADAYAKALRGMPGERAALVRAYAKRFDS